jgi:hypothetical protein
VIGKLIGKVLGEAAALPVTVAGELAEAGATAVDQAGKAITRGMDKVEGNPPKGKRR